MLGVGVRSFPHERPRGAQLPSSGPLALSIAGRMRNLHLGPKPAPSNIWVSLWDEPYPQDAHVETLTPSALKCNDLEIRSLKRQLSENEVTGWAQSNVTGVLTEKRKFGHRHTQREDHVETQGKGSHLQAKDRGPGTNQPLQHLYLGLLASRNVKKMCFYCFLLFKAPGLWLWRPQKTSTGIGEKAHARAQMAGQPDPSSLLPNFSAVRLPSTS